MLDILLTIGIGLFVIIVLICIVFSIGTALSLVTHERDWLTNIDDIGLLIMWISLIVLLVMVSYLTGKLVIILFNRLF